jgi:hypothetical protein
MKDLKVTRQEWAHEVEIYAVEMTYRGMELIGLTKKSALARKVISGARGARAAARQLALDLKQQHGIFRIN